MHKMNEGEYKSGSVNGSFEHLQMLSKNSCLVIIYLKYMYTLRVVTHFSGCHILDNLNSLKHICDLKKWFTRWFQVFLPNIYIFLFLNLGNFIYLLKLSLNAMPPFPSPALSFRVFILHWTTVLCIHFFSKTMDHLGTAHSWVEFPSVFLVLSNSSHWQPH